jgi:HAMP domain-containing protein
MEIVTLIKDFGFPILATCGMGYFLYFVWRWVTEEIDPVLGATMGTLIKLVDRIRILDNNLIRMKMKIDTTLEMREKIRAAELEELRNQNPPK